jgi:hypothetical protein
MCPQSSIPPEKPLPDWWAWEWVWTRASLERSGRHPQAWLWRIRLRILTFLLSRYGHRRPAAPPRAPRPVPRAVNRLQVEGPSPRSAASLRTALERIAQLNRERPQKRK